MKKKFKKKFFKPLSSEMSTGPLPFIFSFNFINISNIILRLPQAPDQAFHLNTKTNCLKMKKKNVKKKKKIRPSKIILFEAFNVNHQLQKKILNFIYVKIKKKNYRSDKC